MEEQQKTDLVRGFTSIVRQSQLAGAVDIQRLGMAFRMTLDSIEPGQPIELQPLFDFLVKEQKAAEPAVVELCVVLKAREARLGCLFTSPGKTQYLGPEVIEHILGQFAARNERAPAGAFEKRESSSKQPISPGLAGIPRTPGPSPEPEVRNPARTGAPNTRRYIVALAVTALGCVGFYGWHNVTIKPPIHAITAPVDPGALPCTALVTDGAHAICDIPLTLWTNNAADVKARALVTKIILSRDGLNLLSVRTTEDGNIVFMK